MKKYGCCYHSDEILNKIANWPFEDTFNMIDYIIELWCYSDESLIKWGKEWINNLDCLFLELHTLGWSGNESIIAAIHSNEMFELVFHTKWERGGHWYYEITAISQGYYSIQETIERTGITRQAINKSSKFERLVISPKKILYRLKHAE